MIIVAEVLVLTRTAFVVVLGFLFSVVSAQAADKDKKGKRREKDLGPAVETQIRSMFDRLDGDKDTFLDKAELGRAFQNQQSVKVFLDAYDDDDDGKISHPEFEDAGRDFAENAQKTAEQIRKAQEQALKRAGSNRKAILRRTPAGRNAFHQLRNQFGQGMRQ
jgi:hypothetical protein